MLLTERSLSVAITLALLGGSACTAGIGESAAETEPISRTGGMRSAIKAAAPAGDTATPTTSAVPSTSSEYKFPASVDPEVQPDIITELWARVYHPTALVPGRRYPVLLFLHGNHGTCGHGSNPRLDDSNQYTLTGTCPPGYVVTPNHEGYAYVANSLASQGYIVVAINANRGITLGDGVPTDPAFILARANLVLRHLEMLSQWDRGVAATPVTLTVNLRDHLDFSQVGLMGHSRGGEGVRLAPETYRAAGSPWPGRIVTPVRFRGVFEIAPVDGQGPSPTTIQDLRWAVMLPMCDGDLVDLQGIRPFDRVMSVLDETPPGFKSSLTIWGANHNFFNSEWQITDSSGCSDHTPLFSQDPTTIGSPTQQEVGRVAMASFFMGNVGEAHDPALNAVFDPILALPPSLGTITRVDRGFTLSPDQNVTLRLEDFVNPTGTSTYGLPNQSSGLSMLHTVVFEHDPSSRGAHIVWENGSASVFFQTNFTPTGSGLSLLGYETLDLRVDRSFNELLNPSETATDFTVQLVSADDVLSAPQRIASYVDLIGPVGGPLDRHSMLQTARIPLAGFAPTTLNAIRGVRLTFDRTSSGVIYVANIRATRATCAVTPKLDLKMREVVRRANEIQFRFQIMNHDSTPVRLSDLSLKMWLSDPTPNLVAQVYYGGHVYSGSGAYQFGSVATTSVTSRLQPACVPAPNRAADWAVAIAGNDSRTLPANGGVWTDGEFTVHRGDWSNLSSLADDYSQTPAYQGGVVSDATWPSVLGDDAHFVLYYLGSPVAEYASTSATDPNGGSEPSCSSSCIASVTEGRAPKYLASQLSPSVGAPIVGPLAPFTVAQATMARLTPTSRGLVPGGVDLEAVSDTAFPTGDAVATLRAGTVEVVLSRRPDPNDMRRLTFTFTADQFVQLKGGEPLSIHYGRSARSPQWNLGQLDVTKLTK